MNTCFRKIFLAIVLFFYFLNFTPVLAQCAGIGSEITVCNKEIDPGTQTFNLFDQLTGETAGGVWIAENNFNSNALDEATGILNLWQINRFGPHTFTYTNPACDTSASSVIINLGGYPGESNQNTGANNVCQVVKNDDDDEINIIDLFIFLDTINGLVRPDADGVWAEDSSNLELGVLQNEFFDFGDVPIGIYTFTYTIPEVDSCLERFAIIDVEVRRSPNPGVPLHLNVCETDDLSGFTSLDLFSRLIGEDSNGVWTDANSTNTGEITSGTDSEIDVQNIYNNFGPGFYQFRYEVLPEHPVCEQRISAFNICIEEQLTLEVDSVDITCDGLVTLSYNDSILDDEMYTLFYTVNGNVLGTHSNNKDILFENGIAEFSLYPELGLVTSELLTLEITNLIGLAPCGTAAPLCAAEIIAAPVDFGLYVAPIIWPSSISGCEFDDVVITYMNAVDANFIPLNGSIPFTYSVNTVSYTDEVNFLNGNATSTVSSQRFMQGSNQLVFFETNAFVHCGDIIETIDLIPAPPNPIFSITPDNICDARNIQFGFNSPAGEFISYDPVTFDIYQYGSEPNLFDPRDTSVSLTTNTEGNGIDINFVNNNDVSSFPEGDYVFVIRSVQNDNALCRGLGQAEIDSYATQGIEIALTKIDTFNIFDARLTFRIGEQPSASLIKNNFQVCLLNGPITLNELSIFAGPNVDISITDLANTELPDSYEITGSDVFNAVFKSALTGCDLGTEQLTVTVVSQASSPILNANTFCRLVSNTVGDLDVSGQNIVWYDSEIGGIVYNATDIIDVNNNYWAEITISGGCASTNRALAEINFTDKANTPTPLSNEFCASATPVISDLLLETSATNITWYTSETGAPYASTALPLDATKAYWASQTPVDGCESDRVQVTYTLTDVVPNPVPLNNNFCTAGGIIFTLEDLEFTEASISREGNISYFSDEAGTTPISTTELLENISSPIYVQQVIAGSCISDLIEVNFAIQATASKPVISPVTFCLENNPTIQNVIDVLEAETSSTISIFNDETTLLPLDVNLELTSLSGDIYASQTLVEGCESAERTLVVFTLSSPILLIDDFITVNCSIDVPTLNNTYLGTKSISWFDENGNTLSGTEILQGGVSYFAQIEEDTCKSEILEVVMNVVDIQNPQPNSSNADFCGIEENVIADLLEDASGSARFNIPLDHTLVWYDSNDVSSRNELNNNSVIENGMYYAVYEISTTINGETILCESDAVAITVDLTVCDPEALIIPDAFSPNNDSTNDTFELKNIEFVFPDYDITIYNRYGRIVFKGDESIGFWNGKSNQSGFLSNDLLPTGVYFYVINFNRFNKKPYQGQVYLKR